MAYFADLTPYRHHGTRADIPAVRVGWLSRDHPFPTAPPELELVQALHRCCFRADCYAMGIHRCDLCGDRNVCASVDGREAMIGTGEIHVEHAGICYAAPTLVVHYVEAHSYLPPAPFIAGALSRASRIALLSLAERDALALLPLDEQRGLACEAVERMVKRSTHPWARAGRAAARTGQRNWDVGIAEEVEYDALAFALGRLSSLMNDAPKPPRAPDEDDDVLHHFLDIIERERDG